MNDDRRKAMINELRTLHDSKCPYVVNCYGAFFVDGATIRVVLELMDGGSLDAVCKRIKFTMERGKYSLSGESSKFRFEVSARYVTRRA